MKKRFFIVAIVLISASCATPDKEQTTGSTDTLATGTPPAITVDSSQMVAPGDSVGLDSLNSVRAFDKTDSSTYYELQNYFKDQAIAIEPAEIQMVDSTCAILIYPTEEQLAQLRAENGDAFQTIASDNIYYHGMAIQMLDSINVETVTANARYINFEGGSPSQSWTLDIRKEGAPPWNLIFFHKTKEPEIVPFVDLSRQKIIEYFQIQKKAN